MLPPFCTESVLSKDQSTAPKSEPRSGALSICASYGATAKNVTNIHFFVDFLTLILHFHVTLVGTIFNTEFQWHALSKEEQQKYYEMARKEREKHMVLYPGWSARDNYGKRKKAKERFSS